MGAVVTEEEEVQAWANGMTVAMPREEAEEGEEGVMPEEEEEAKRQEAMQEMLVEDAGIGSRPSTKLT